MLKKLFLLAAILLIPAVASAKANWVVKDSTSTRGAQAELTGSFRVEQTTQPTSVVAVYIDTTGVIATVGPIRSSSTITAAGIISSPNISTMATKIDALSQSTAGFVTAGGDNTFTGNNTFTVSNTFSGVLGLTGGVNLGDTLVGSKGGTGGHLKSIDIQKGDISLSGQGYVTGLIDPSVNCSSCSANKNYVDLQQNSTQYIKNSSEVQVSSFSVSSGTAGSFTAQNSTITKLNVTTLTGSSGTVTNMTVTASTAASTKTNILIFGDGSVQTTAASGSAGQSASTSAAMTQLMITTAGVDTNMIMVTAETVDVMGCYFTNFSSGASLAKSGPGGSNLADPISTWHRVFIISKTDCSTSSVIVDSGSVTTPALPSGYTKWRPVGYMFNDGSSNLRPTIKRGNHVVFHSAIRLLSAVDPGVTPTALDLSNYLSPTAFSARFQLCYEQASVTGFIRLFLSGGQRAPDSYLGTDATAWAMKASGVSSDLIILEEATVSLMSGRTIFYGDSPDVNHLDLYLREFMED